MDFVFLRYSFIIPLPLFRFPLSSSLILGLSFGFPVSLVYFLPLSLCFISVSVSVLSSLSVWLFSHKLLLVWCFFEFNKLCSFSNARYHVCSTMIYFIKGNLRQTINHYSTTAVDFVLFRNQRSKLGVLALQTYSYQMKIQGGGRELHECGRPVMV